MNFKKWLSISEGGGLWDGNGGERKIQGQKKPSDGWLNTSGGMAAQPMTPPKQMKKMKK